MKNKKRFTAFLLAASMLFINTNSSLFAKEEAKGEEISEQSDKTRQPSSISYAPTQQALSGSIPPEETKEEPKEEAETPKTKEAVQTVEVKTTIYLDANKNEKKDKEEKGVSHIEVRLYKMLEGTVEKEASYQAIINIKGEVYPKDVEAGSYRIEYESMDSEKDLKDYTGVSGNDENTKKLSENAMIIQGKASLVLSTVVIDTDKQYFRAGTDIQKSDFKVYKVYSDESLVLIPEDQFHIDLKTVPNNDKEVFNLKFTLIQDEIGKTISKTEAFVIQREIALDQLMVKNGVTDLISGKHVILNEGDVIIPEEILYNEKPYFITSIGSLAFYMNKAITSIKIPESIKSIEYEAFYYCENLKGELILPKTLNYIGRFAFYYGSGLTGNLVIPDSVTSIGNYAFLSCDSLEKIIIQGKSEGEITGSPWGAPDTVTIEWQPSQEGA